MWAPLDAEDVFEELAGIRDPEFTHRTLAELAVVAPDRVTVTPTGPRHATVRVTLKPTVPHCHLISNICLSVKVKLYDALPVTTFYKVVVDLVPGSHNDEAAVVKQANDKERFAAALERPDLLREIRRLTDPFAASQ